MKSYVMGLSLIAVGAVILGGSSGCGDPAVPQVGITTQLTPGSTGSDCALATQVPLSIGDPDDNMIKDGVDNTDTSCSVVPSGGGFTVNASARLLNSGSKNAGFTLSGTFIAPDPKNLTGTTMQNITMLLQDEDGAFKSTVCTADYTYFTPIDRATQPMPNSGVAAGRVWATVRCLRAENTNKTEQTHKACETRATFRFENCATSGS